MISGGSLCTCSYAFGQGPAIGPHIGERCWPLLAEVWRAIAPLMKPWCAEGVVPIAANLYRGWKSCVGWHRDDEPLFGECGDAKFNVSVILVTQQSSDGSVSPVRMMKDTCAGLAMVTFLSWMANARISFFIVRTLAANRNGSTLRSAGSNKNLFLSFVEDRSSMLFAKRVYPFLLWGILGIVFFELFGFSSVSCVLGRC